MTTKSDEPRVSKEEVAVLIKDRETRDDNFTGALSRLALDLQDARTKSERLESEVERLRKDKAAAMNLRVRSSRPSRRQSVSSSSASRSRRVGCSLP